MDKDTVTSSTSYNDEIVSLLNNTLKTVAVLCKFSDSAASVATECMNLKAVPNTDKEMRITASLVAECSKLSYVPVVNNVLNAVALSRHESQNAVDLVIAACIRAESDLGGKFLISCTHVGKIEYNIIMLRIIQVSSKKVLAMFVKQFTDQPTKITACFGQIIEHQAQNGDIS